MTSRTRDLAVLVVLVGNAALMAGGLLAGKTATVAAATVGAIAGSVYFALRFHATQRSRKEN